MVTNNMKKLSNFWIYCLLIFFALVPILFVNVATWLTIITFVIITFLCIKFKIKKFPLFLFIISLAIRIIFNLIVETPPISDFEELLRASRLLMIGDTSFNDSRYFFLWAYQIGFVSYQTLLLKICNSVLFLKIVNCILSSGICVFIYLIAKEFVKEKSAQIVSLIYSLLIFTISYTSVLTNQHFSSFLIYLALYILISNKVNIKKYYKYLIAGILIAISNIIRPEAIITILSILIYGILQVKKENLKKVIICLSILLVSYYGILGIANQIFIKTNIGPYGLKNNAPYWKFVLGFNHETKGGYCDADGYVLNDKEAGMELIKERVLVNPIKHVSLFKNKINTFWNNTTLVWSFHEIYYKNIIIGSFSFNLSKILDILSSYNSKIMFSLYVLIIVGILHSLKVKKLDKKLFLLINQVFVTFGVFLLIEVQPRYSYFIQISIAILAALGVDYLLDLYYKNSDKIKKKLRIGVKK